MDVAATRLLLVCLLRRLLCSWVLRLSCSLVLPRRCRNIHQVLHASTLEVRHCTCRSQMVKISPLIAPTTAVCSATGDGSRKQTLVPGAEVKAGGLQGVQRMTGLGNRSVPMTIRPQRCVSTATRTPGKHDCPLRAAPASGARGLRRRAPAAGKDLLNPAVRVCAGFAC